MKNLLVTGPDENLENACYLAQKAYPDRIVEKLFIPAHDYYAFDFSSLADFSPDEWEVSAVVNEFYVNDVRRAFCESIKEQGYSFTSLISPQAHVSAEVRIGENAVIHAGCFIGANSIIGDHCVFQPNVVLIEGITVGHHVTLEANVSIREKCMIGNFTTICANSSLMRTTEVGDHCYLNVPNQYSGNIPACTFYSPAFPNPITIR